MEISDKTALDLSQNWQEQQVLDCPTAAIFPSLLVGSFHQRTNKIHGIASRDNLHSACADIFRQ